VGYGRENLVSDTILGLVVGAAVGIVGIIASLAGTMSSNRSSERRLIIQLQNEEIKRALTTLHSLLNSNEEAYIYAGKIWQFLNSMDSAYLPNDVRAWATKKHDDFWDEHQKAFPDDYDFSAHQAQMDEDEYQAFYDDLDPTQRREEDFRVFRERLRKESTSYLKQALTGRPSKAPKFANIKRGFKRAYLTLQRKFHRKRSPRAVS